MLVIDHATGEIYLDQDGLRKVGTINPDWISEVAQWLGSTTETLCKIDSDLEATDSMAYTAGYEEGYRDGHADGKEVGLLSVEEGARS